MGGDITWVCLGNGQYKFTMRIYRDCNGNQLQLPIVLRVWNHPTVTQIPMNLISETDISPQCNGAGPTINCGMGNPSSPVEGAVEEFIFESNSVTLFGFPPPEGWVFTYDDCCRDNSINNLVNPGSYGMTLKAIMYQYNGNNASPCTDSSPVFTERPAIIICAGSPYKYNHNAFDPDLDSLHYSWDVSLNHIDNLSWDIASGIPAQIPFQSGFSVNSPFPGPALNPNNVPATLDPNTGEVAFTSYNLGRYNTVVRVQSYRCGQLVAEVFREIIVVLLSCAQNTEPDVVGPFTDPVSGLPSFDTTVYAGDLVTFNIDGTDLEYLAVGPQQSVTLSASGGQFGTGYTNPNAGCPFPPCATLTPPTTFTGAPGQGAQTTFSWQTDCSHIAQFGECYAPTNLYTFIFKFKDDFCPAPSQNIATVSIHVLAQPAEPSPELRCLAVQPNGDIQLSWVPIPNTVNTFNKYVVYSALTPTGPFVPIDSIANINASTYTHIGAGGNAQSRYYFIRTRSGCNGSILSPAIDTLRSIYLSVTDPLNGTEAQLAWNRLVNPPLPTTSIWYRVYKEFPAGTWTLIDSTQIQAYIDPLAICVENINYRVEIDDASGCTSVSNIDGMLFQNITPPDSAVIDSVSINAAGQAVIGWQPGPSTDVIGYIVYQSTPTGLVPLDTLQGYNNTSYVNLLSNAANASETYLVAAFDSCSGYGNSSLYHSTLFVNAAVDGCTGDAVLIWNAYQGMTGGVDHYDVYQSQAGGAYSYLMSSPNNGVIVPNITTGVSYCFYVQAIGNNPGLTSTSNIACLTSDSVAQSQFLYTNRATVSQYGYAFVSCLVDTSAIVVDYNLYRTDTIGGNFALFQTLDRLPGSQFVTYTDMSANTAEKVYTYRFTAVDKCGEESVMSNIGRTILLRGKSNYDMTNTITWNRYEQWNAGVSHYNVYRKVDFEPTFTYVTSIPAASFFSYDDDVRQYANTSNGRFCYYIEAIENNGNIYGLKDTSRSNTLCLQQEETIYIPNAFTPQGLNPVFKPEGTFIDSVKYSFHIYNRWGELMYETYKPGEGWDGFYKGEVVPEGVYAYIVRYQTTGYRDRKRTGLVIVLR